MGMGMGMAMGLGLEDLKELNTLATTTPT